jgi:predicted amidophosphoribosyltransferase
VLDLLLPERCAICSASGPSLCERCRTALVRLHEPVCERCGSPGAWPVRRCAECSGRRLSFATARAAIAYDARARAFVREWKERGRRKLARQAAALVVEVVPRPSCEALAFVPGDPKRARERGDVPPRGLARELGKLWGLPVLEILRRERTLSPQRGLSLAERRRNARGTVAATGPAPAAVAVVDDVYTSGATADACGSALRRAGTRRVEVVTLARAVR